MPIRIDDTDARAVVIDRREAQLDAATTSRIEHELFTAWLDERHRNADVEWHWGDALRNEFGAVTVRPRRRVAVVLQTARSDCGAACLAMVPAARGCPRPLVEVRDLLDPGRDGVTALDLRDAGRQLGLTARAVRVDVAAHGPAALTGLQLPVVAHWAGQHFVVVEGITPEGAEVIDPAVGRLRLSVEEFRRAATGVVLEFRRSDGAPARPARMPGAVRTLLAPVLRENRRSLLRVLGVSLLLLILGLSLPVATALVADPHDVRAGRARVGAGSRPRPSGRRGPPFVGACGRRRPAAAFDRRSARRGDGGTTPGRALPVLRTTRHR